MAKKITEKHIRGIVAESLAKMLNEISYGTVEKAAYRNDDLFLKLGYKFDDFYEALYDYTDTDLSGEYLWYAADENKYIQEIRKYADAINDILKKKKEQNKYFYGELTKFNANDYYNSPEGQEEDYDDKDIHYLQQKYPRKLNEMISNTVEQVINEGIYDYPDGIDHIIFLSDNDRECYDIYQAIKDMLVKKAKRGVELSVEVLANSSVMKKYQQLCFRKFKKDQIEQGIFDQTAPAAFRQYTAERMIEDVNYEVPKRPEEKDLFGTL